MASVMEKFLDWNTPQWEQGQKSFAERLKKTDMPKVWAHRGCSMRYPENTLLSFKAAAEVPGITGIELDVQLTRDNEIVVFHDENVGRVTDGDKAVKEYSLEEMSAFSNKVKAFAFEKISEAKKEDKASYTKMAITENAKKKANGLW